ncbi:hypothetical protein [Leekyejoonella antrihumi]|nr:hypothetical protein [Leekyejoonella antrihumi]
MTSGSFVGDLEAECWHLDTYVRAGGTGWRCRWSQATDTIKD